MATVAMPARRVTAERLFYSGMALFVLLAMFAGFAPTYYLRAINPHPITPVGGFTPLLHLHGLVFTAWIALFVTQTWLVAGRRTDIHRKLGRAGAVLLVLMILVGIGVAVAALHRPANPPGVTPQAWFAVPMLDVPVFAALIALGIAARKQPQSHKRYLLIAMIGLLPPGIARLPWPHEIPLPITLFAIPDLPLLALAAWDLRTRGKLHPVTIGASAFLIGSQIFRLLIWNTPQWTAFADWVGSISA